MSDVGEQVEEKNEPEQFGPSPNEDVMQASGMAPIVPGDTVNMADAAAILNLPPTLLESFVSYEFNEQRLECLNRKRGTFLRQDVEAYARHLDSRWPDSKRHIPSFVKRYVDIEAEASGGCASCRLRSSSYDYAHINSWEKSRCHSPHNIVRLCPTRHRDHGNETRRLKDVKDLARRRLWATQIDESERRRVRFRITAIALAASMALFLSAAGLFAWWDLERARAPRRVNVARLAARLAPFAPGKAEVVVDMSAGAEAAALAEQIRRSFVAAGFDCTHAIAALTPPLYSVEIALPQGVTTTDQVPHRLRWIGAAIASEDIRVIVGATQRYSQGKVTVTVGAKTPLALGE